MSSRTPLAVAPPLRLDPARPAEPAQDEGWPPPPHDPRERELALVVAGWEVRLFVGRKFEYFVARGFWHLQLWHPEARVSVLTPSRLTCGLYEAYPIANWKAQAPDYDKLVTLLGGLFPAKLPERSAVLRLERALVAEVVRGSGGVPS
ncbi:MULTISPECIES: hypothetical protein [Sorangium]|uniref:Uncharacterized protein n=1 Tax=Sorangium cellulosum TaxID=56 RepID=A0A4P2QZA9_SORCE|nr:MULTISPECIES: hypothetical protein [Sorangium]AUX34913.1 uncharacterized protein SOCE836_070930 [Sorangium cellulosum]WCQ94220.1 hypothetical protein NQZ70_06977 [Sorangium sp. Soce836]